MESKPIQEKNPLLNFGELDAQGGEIRDHPHPLVGTHEHRPLLKQVTYQDQRSGRAYVFQSVL